ncbi:phenylalanine--tRNA ligase subunit alpha [bacterium]|nr:phenylalanine--tRNA ligase subunit alpha [bacterium]
MHNEVEITLKEALELLENASSESDILRIKGVYVGKNGKITQLLKLIPTLNADEKPVFGQQVNKAKEKIVEKVESCLEQIKVKRTGSVPDQTLPGRRNWLGSRHPISAMVNQIVEVFYGMGFELAGGPDIETEYYNFDALNTPADHPSRDLNDTFYTKNGMLLRTQTSPVQIRVMKQQEPPVRIIAPGRCYRRDTIDASHHILFTQVEGLFIDREVTLADLKGVLTTFAHRILGPGVKIRFRPHFFPFTEPSVEYDFSCLICQMKGCPVCKGTGWVEISGAGMVDPAVLKEVGYDPEKWQGYAFGMGLERIAMLKYGINDIRLFLENDLRFLKQFNF